MDARDNTQKTPLHYAAQWGQEEALDFLIECGADVNAADFIEDTPLHLVSRNIKLSGVGRISSFSWISYSLSISIITQQEILGMCMLVL